eukprot:scaffold249313_cov74-Cyclotella_meneghiniana.AAC.6
MQSAKTSDGGFPTMHIYMTRNFFEFIVVKLVLEVFGAAGAVWGCSEVFRLRDEAAIPNSSYTTNDVVRIISLLVLGGCGAIWGCSEAVGLRNDKSNEQWRIAAAISGLLFLVRWLKQILSYCSLTASPIQDSFASHILFDWFEIFVIKVILEVFGAVGAIWGFSQLVFLRTEESIEFWRVVAISTMIGFAARWFIIMMQFTRSENIGEIEKLEKQDSDINDLALTETDMLSPRESSPHPYQSASQRGVE